MANLDFSYNGIPASDFPSETETALSDTPAPRVPQGSEWVRGDLAYPADGTTQPPSLFRQPTEATASLSDVPADIAAHYYDMVSGWRSILEHVATTPEAKAQFGADAREASQQAQAYRDSRSPGSKVEAPLFSWTTLLRMPLSLIGMAPEFGALGAAGLAGGPIGIAGMGAILTAGNGLSRIYQTVQNMPIKEFLDASPEAQRLVFEEHVDPEVARGIVLEKSIGYWPWLDAAAGAAAYGITALPGAGGLLPGLAERGFLPRLAGTAAIGGAAFGGQGAVSAEVYNQATAGLPVDKADPTQEALSSAEYGAMFAVPFVGKRKPGRPPFRVEGPPVEKVPEIGSTETDAAINASKAPAPAPKGVLDAGATSPDIDAIRNAIEVARSTGNDADAARLQTQLDALLRAQAQPGAGGGPPTGTTTTVTTPEATPGPATTVTPGSNVGPPGVTVEGGGPAPPAGPEAPPGVPTTVAPGAPGPEPAVTVPGGGPPAPGPEVVARPGGAPPGDTTVVADNAPVEPGGVTVTGESAAPEAAPAVTEPVVAAPGAAAAPDDYARAVDLVRAGGKVSTALIQRKLNIGYARAAAIIDRMEKEGVVGPAVNGKREVLTGTPEAAPAVTEPAVTESGAAGAKTAKVRAKVAAKGEAPAETVPPKAGAKGEKAVAVARKPAVLRDLKTKAADQTAVVTKNIAGANAEEAKAVSKERVTAAKEAGEALPTKKSNASVAADKERAAALGQLFTDNGPRAKDGTANWTMPGADLKEGASPTEVHASWTKWLDRVIALGKQAEAHKPKAHIHPGASNGDLFGREIMDLAETARRIRDESLDSRQTKAAMAHIQAFVGRINSVKVKEDGTFDTSLWRKDRKAEGELNRKGGTGSTADVTEALPEAPSRTTGATAHEKPEVGKDRIIPATSEEGKRIAAEAAAKLGPAKLGKSPGKTEGTTTPVTSGSNKKVGPKAAVILEKVKAKDKPKPPAEQSTAGLDRKVKKVTTRVEDLTERVKEATPGTVMHARLTEQLKEAQAAELGVADQVDRRAAGHGEPPPTAEDVTQAHKDVATYRARIERLVAAGKDETNGDLARARQQLAAAEMVLVRAGQPYPSRGMARTVASGRTDIWSANRGETPAAVGSVIRRIQLTGKTPPAKLNNTIVRPDGSGVIDRFKSIVNTTVGALTKDINVEALATRIFGFNSPDGDAIIHHIFEVTKNIPVHFLDQDRDISHFGSDPFMGAHITGGDGKGRIFFDVRSVADGSENSFHQVLLHEVMHGFTTHHLETDPQFHALIEDLRTYAADKLGYHAGYRGFHDADEFIAELFSNPEFSQLLQEIPAPPHMIARLGLDRLRGIAPTVFDALIFAIGRLFPYRRTSVFEAVARIVGDQTAKDTAPPLWFPNAGKPRPMARLMPAVKVGDHMRSVRDWTARTVDHVINSDAPEHRHGKIRAIKLATGDYIARMSDKYFGAEKNPVRQLVEGFERTRVDSAKELDAALPLVKRMFDAESKHGPEQWSKFVDVAHDATNAGIYPDRAFDKQGFTKDGLSDVQGKARHAELAAAYAALPEDLKTLYKDAYRFYSAQQNKLNLATIRNRLLKIAEIPLDADGEALANRIFLNRMTEADTARLGDLAAPLAKTNILGKVKGAYFPLMRRGDHVITGRYKVAAPLASAKATRVANREGNLIYEFGAGNVNKTKARREAMAYAARLPQHARIDSVWVDRKTGELYFDDETGPVKVMSNDVQADHRWRVTVQDRHVEFAQGLRNADRRAAELRASPTIERVDPVQEVAQQNFPGGGYLATQLRTLQTSMEKRPGYSGLPDAVRSQMAQVFREGSMRLLAATRIETRSLPRRHVAGAGREVVKDMLDYARASGGRLAQLRHAPQVDAALKELDRVAGDTNPQSLGRSQIANEMRDRAIKNNGYSEGGRMTAALQRFMGLTFSTDLASPSHSMVNLTQVPMLSYPALAARHGPIKAFTAIRRAYRDVGVLGHLKKGAADTGRAVVGKDISYDYLSRLRDSLPETERAVIDYAVDVGTLDPEVGMDVAKSIDTYHSATPGGEAAAKAGRMIDWAQTVARQLPRATEVINRSTVLLAAYRLERGRGATHEMALRKAVDTVNQTQFHYAASNRAPIFNKPMVRLLMQFKQYPLGVMQMVGENLSKAYHNLETGDRAEAAKTIAYLVGTHVAMAGTLGLPTEPFKVLVIALGAAGVPVTWAQVEDFERQAASAALGKFGGLMVTRGLPAALGGVDLSGRLGMSNWFTYGEPDSHSAKDTFLWATAQFFGAPGGLVMNQLRGLGFLAAGDYEQAAENIIPFKGLSSVMRGIRESGGKYNPAGRQTMEAYSPTEAIIRGLGFTPTRESEAGTARTLFHQQTARYQGKRQDILNAWFNARPSDRGRMWGDVERYNRQLAPADRIKRSELDNYVTRRGKEVTSGGEVMRNPGDAGRMKALLQTYGE